MKRLLRSLAVAAVLGLLVMPTQAQAQTTITPGVWYDVLFESDGMGGAETDDSFLLPGSWTFDLFYRDCCLAGDEYELYADGSFVGTAAGDPGEVVSFASAASGGQLITIEMPVFGGGLPAGSSFRADVSVPEPGTGLLVATGILLLGFCIPRRREDEVAEVS